MSQKILGDLRGIYTEMRNEEQLRNLEEQMASEISISISLSMLSEGRTIEDIVDFLENGDLDELEEKYNSGILIENYNIEQYATQLIAIDEAVGALLKVGLKKLLPAGMRFARQLAKSKNPGKTGAAIRRLTARKAETAGMGRQSPLGASAKDLSKNAASVVNKSNAIKTARRVGRAAVIPAVGAVGYTLGKIGSSEEPKKEEPKAEADAPKKDEKPAYPGGQTKSEGEAVNKKYQELRTKAVDAKGKIKDTEAVKKAEDYGKAQWAKLYPELAKKVKSDGTQKGTGQSKMEKDAAELRAMQKASQERQEADKKKVKKEAYEVILDYLISEGHADTVEEAHYVMMQMDAENIQSIITEN